MAGRGPPPKPTNLLKLSTPWRAAQRGAEPQPDRGRPDMPDFADRRCEAEWERLCSDLESMGVLSMVDGRAIERYCVILIQWRDAAKFVADNGMTYSTVSRTGEESFRRYPEAAQMKDLGVELRQIEQEFGLTPSARARLSVRPPGVKDGNGDRAAAAS